MQDVVIIGSGPAGLSAALYMLRGGFSTTVIGKDNGALEKAEKSKIILDWSVPSPVMN